MTIAVTTNRNDYTANGSNDTFGYEFNIWTKTELKVYVDDALQTLDLHYTVTPDESEMPSGESGGNVVFDVSYIPADQSVVTIIREIPNTQLMDLIEGGVVSAETLETAFDRVTVQIQQLKDDLDSAILEILTDATPPIPAEARTILDVYSTSESDAITDALEATLDAHASQHENSGSDEIDVADLSGELADVQKGKAQSSTEAGLPSASSNARHIYKTTDGIRGTRISSGTSWIHEYGETINPREWEITGDGSDEYSKWASMITAAPAGSKIVIPPPSSYYGIGTAITVNKALAFLGHHQPEIKQKTAATKGFIITASNVALLGIKLTGYQYASSQSSERAIDAYGADSDNYISNIRVEKCNLNTWGMYAIYHEFVRKFHHLDNEIENIYYAAIMALSCSRGWIERNDITNITGTPNAYGIAASRQNGALATYPRSSHIDIRENYIYGVPNWEGIDTHAGEYIDIVENDVMACWVGIAVGASQDASEYKFAPHYVSVISNKINSGATDGSMGYGLSLTGAYNGTSIQELAKAISAIDNKVYGHGEEDDSASGGLYAYGLHGARINENYFDLCSPNGMSLYLSIFDSQVNNNVILSPWSNTVGVGEAVAINIRGFDTGRTISRVMYEGNQWQDYGGTGKTYRLDSGTGIGIKVKQQSGNSGVLGTYINGADTAVSDANPYLTDYRL